MVDVDLQRLLAHLRTRDANSVRFEVRPVARGADLDALLDAVNVAANQACESSARRHPADPTSLYGVPSVAKASIVTEIVDGPMTEEEVTAWFTDFAHALEPHRVRVVPAPAPRLPWRTFDDWALGPDRVLTGFFYFTADHVTHPNGWRAKTRTHSLVEETADDVVSLVQVTDGTPVVDRGDAAFVSSAERQAAELRARPADFLGVRQFTLKPRRWAAFKFGLGNDASLQTFDETQAQAEMLQRLVAGLRLLGPRLDYAFVRRDRLVIPSATLYRGTLEREPTEAEGYRFNEWAAEEYVVAPSVAQVLGPRHLVKRPDLSAFAVEELTHGRVLAVARDVEPWIRALNPEPGVLLAATEAFGALIPSGDDLDACR